MPIQAENPPSTSVPDAPQPFLMGMPTEILTKIAKESIGDPNHHAICLYSMSRSPVKFSADYLCVNADPELVYITTLSLVNRRFRDLLHDIKVGTVFFTDDLDIMMCCQLLEDQPYRFSLDSIREVRIPTIKSLAVPVLRSTFMNLQTINIGVSRVLNSRLRAEFTFLDTIKDGLHLLEGDYDKSMSSLTLAVLIDMVPELASGEDRRGLKIYFPFCMAVEALEWSKQFVFPGKMLAVKFALKNDRLKVVEKFFFDELTGDVMDDRGDAADPAQDNAGNPSNNDTTANGWANAVATDGQVHSMENEKGGESVELEEMFNMPGFANAKVDTKKKREFVERRWLL
ncbi:hypothetical protein LTS08_006282 [Lithohypha guttulata]|nr:hypothetical protein LTS08_006282 [Lithohypha guttulata]